MTELALTWFRAVWGREALRQKIENLQEKYTRTLGLAKAVIEVNRAQASTIENLEARDRELSARLAEALEWTKIIDPNAKCPGCGATEGHLTHVAKGNDVRIVNNCNRCGLPFISAEPVAGIEGVRAAYQPAISALESQFRG